MLVCLRDSYLVIWLFIDVFWLWDLVTLLFGVFVFEGVVWDYDCLPVTVNFVVWLLVVGCWYITLFDCFFIVFCNLLLVGWLVFSLGYLWLGLLCALVVWIDCGFCFPVLHTCVCVGLLRRVLVVVGVYYGWLFHFDCFWVFGGFGVYVYAYCNSGEWFM